MPWFQSIENLSSTGSSPVPSLSQFLSRQKWTCSGSVSLSWVCLSSVRRAKFSDLIPPTLLAVKWPSFPMDISLQKMLVEELTNPVMLKGHISLKHVSNFFSPTTVPNRISDGDYYCLVASSITNVCTLPHFLLWRPFWRHLLQQGGKHQSPLGSTDRQLAWEDSENLALCFLFHVICIWTQTCLLASALMLDSPSALTSIF